MIVIVGQGAAPVLDTTRTLFVKRSGVALDDGAEYVAGEATKGIAQASMRHGIPVALGVLTTDTLEQAIERAGSKAGNKGVDAAVAAIEMANLLAQLRK